MITKAEILRRMVADDKYLQAWEATKKALGGTRGIVSRRGSSAMR